MARTEQNVVENEQKAEEMNVNGIEAAKQDERTETVVSVAEAAFEKGLNGNDTEEATEKKTKAELPALYIYGNAVREVGQTNDGNGNRRGTVHNRYTRR